jgi:hypothetical protein
MQFVPFEDGIEVNGQTVYSVIEGFAAFKKVPSDIFLNLGIGQRGDDGLLRMAPDEWVPQALWLRGFAEIGRAVGTGALFAIGLKIPECAIFPPHVTDVRTAIQSIDVAYHLNHRKGGRVMFDPATGTMLEGIGHYGYAPVAGEPRILSKCSNPYPCDFDKGIITAMARRFAPNAWVDHVEPEVCRKKGASSCAYLVTWNG